MTYDGEGGCLKLISVLSDRVQVSPSDNESYGPQATDITLSFISSQAHVMLNCLPLPRQIFSVK